MGPATTLTGTLLDPLLKTDPMGPRITYYDDATGERIELSTVTLANWAAKTANLVRDEFGAGPGTRVAVLLPAHWQTLAVLLGVWWVGAEVVTAGPADIALCTRERLDEADQAVADQSGEVAVLSLDPFGKPAEDLPIGVTDYATAVRAHGDQVTPERAPGPALDGQSVAEILDEARERARGLNIATGDRVIATEPGTGVVLAVLAAGASLVEVVNPDPALQDRRRESEKVTRALV